MFDAGSKESIDKANASAIHSFHKNSDANFAKPSQNVSPSRDTNYLSAAIRSNISKSTSIHISNSSLGTRSNSKLSVQSHKDKPYKRAENSLKSSFNDTNLSKNDLRLMQKLLPGNNKTKQSYVEIDKKKKFMLKNRVYSRDGKMKRSCNFTFVFDPNGRFSYWMSECYFFKNILQIYKLNEF